MGLPTMRVQAVSDLLNIGALKARNSILWKNSGLNIVYEWTELGFRLMRQWKILGADREAELRAQIASVPKGQFPPLSLLMRPTDDSEKDQAPTKVPGGPRKEPAGSNA
jgi:hypothetical protein